MNAGAIHRWDATYREAVAIQEEPEERLILADEGIPDPLRSVAAVPLY